MRKSLVVAGLLAIIAILTGLWGRTFYSMAKPPALLWYHMAPFSTDPYDYDAFVHHLAFRSVLSSLVTPYKAGTYVGILAESWKVSPDFRTWTFQIRKGLQFENGDLITPEHIVKSWLRIGYIQKQKGSNSEFMELLEEYEQLHSPTQMISGIQIEGQKITLRFIRSMPKALDTISFGLYSVVHPSDYDPKTGDWKDPKKVISSSAYRVEKWEDSRLYLKLRSDFLPEHRHPTALAEVILTWNPKDRDHAQMIAGDSNESEELASRMEFHGSVASSIAYVSCQSWTHPKSPCHDLETRRELRYEYYQALKSQGIQPTLSFFPLAISGIQEAKLTKSALISSKTEEKKLLRYRVSKIRNPYFQNYNLAIKKATERLEISTQAKETPVKIMFQEAEPFLKDYQVDIWMRGTGILIDDPKSDIRFMFLSKEGIRLPDSDGRIRTELTKEDKDDFDPQKINELLWDQAIIWPVGHYAMGLWSQKEIDFSLLNVSLPPTELQWIGWKN